MKRTLMVVGAALLATMPATVADANHDCLGSDTSRHWTDRNDVGFDNSDAQEKFHYLDGDDAYLILSTVSNGGGADYVCGDAGQDVLQGGAGGDHLSGGLHRDTIDGGPGDDEIRGNNGPDTLHGDQGDDVDVLLELGHAAEALREGHRQQEPEEDLHARHGHAQLGEELLEVAVQALALRLVAGHGPNAMR